MLSGCCCDVNLGPDIPYPRIEVTVLNSGGDETPFRFLMRIDKGPLPHPSFGLDLARVDVQEKGHGYLIIRQVKPGFIQDWNLANPDLEVRNGDMIVSANSVDESSAATTATSVTWRCSKN